jgi:hypothetical protein
VATKNGIVLAFPQFSGPIRPLGSRIVTSELVWPQRLTALKGSRPLPLTFRSSEYGSRTSGCDLREDMTVTPVRRGAAAS